MAMTKGLLINKQRTEYKKLHARIGQFRLGSEGTFSTKAIIMGGGTEADPIVNAEADSNFMEIRTRSTYAGDSDNRLAYLRLYVAGAGQSSETLRAFTTVQAVAAANARGAHISLDFSAYATSYITGEGRAVKATLHVPTGGAMHSGGTYSALQAEIYMDGNTSDPSGVTLMSLLDCTVQGGNTAAQVKVKKLMSCVIPTGNRTVDYMHVSALAGANQVAQMTEALQITVNGVKRYIPVLTSLVA